MDKVPRKKLPFKSLKKPASLETQFAEVTGLVRAGRQKAFASVNAALIETYWEVGRYISLKVEKEAWGQGVVKKLAEYLQQSIQDPRGFSSRNLWRMKQFHDFYRGYKKVSTVLTLLPWSSHLLLLSKTKSIEECAGPCRPRQ